MIKTILLSSILLCSCNFALASKIYKWVDENGQVHYGEKPPIKSTTTDEVKIEPSPTTEPVSNSSERLKKQQELINAYSEERRVKTEEKAKELKKKNKLKRDCQIAKNNYKDYINSNRLYSHDKQGNRVYLSESDREKTIKNYKQSIDKHCK